MEKKLKIKVSEKNYIYGRLSGTSRQPLFIIVHGFLETMDGDFYLNATRYFAKQGYATFRFNLYGGEKNARQMIDTTLKINASDIDAVVRYFRRNKRYWGYVQLKSKICGIIYLCQDKQGLM